MLEMDLILLLVCIPGTIIVVDFMVLLFTGRRMGVKGFPVYEALIMSYALVYLGLGLQGENLCCGDSTTFSPDHRLSIDTLVILCMIAYFYSSYKKKIASPVLEVATNCLLLTGMVLNIFICIQIGEWEFWLVGNVPIIILFLFALLKNH